MNRNSACLRPSPLERAAEGQRSIIALSRFVRQKDGGSARRGSASRIAYAFCSAKEASPAIMESIYETSSKSSWVLNQDRSGPTNFQAGVRKGRGGLKRLNAAAYGSKSSCKEHRDQQQEERGQGCTNTLEKKAAEHKLIIHHDWCIHVDSY